MFLERQDFETISIHNLTTDRLNNLAVSNADSKTKETFQKLASMRKDIDAIDLQIRESHRQRQIIVNDQARIRENLKTVSGRTDLGEQYMEKLEAQEQQINKLDQQINTWENQKAKKMQLFEDAVFSNTF